MVLAAQKPQDPRGAAIEAWGQGFIVGGLIVMIAITVANMRRKVLLHKLILIELVLGIFHGTFILTDPPVYNWYLSSTAILLNTSWSIHNVVAWLKTKPFLSKRWSMFYIITVILVQPYWVLEITANFLYFSDTSNLFTHTRPWEALFRDPWWVFTICNLFYNIRARYDMRYLELVKASPRFGVLLVAMFLSIAFMLCDILAVTKVIHSSGIPDGINPFWKLSFVFKCLTDSIILDDFRTALDRLKNYKLAQIGGSFASDGLQDAASPGQQQSQQYTHAAPVQTLDWSKVNTNCEHLDLEEALRSDSKDLR